MLSEVVLTTTSSKRSYTEPDGIKIWKDNMEGSGIGENIGIHTGKNGVSVNTSELSGLGGNPAGAGYMNKFSKITGLIAAILSPIADLLSGDNLKTMLQKQKILLLRALWILH